MITGCHMGGEKECSAVPSYYPLAGVFTGKVGSDAEKTDCVTLSFDCWILFREKM